MNIDNWPMHRIMQLPDWCFGRKFVVSCCVHAGAGATDWDISEITLPENFVVWQIKIMQFAVVDTVSSIRIALGDQLPTAAKMMDALEPLIYGLGLQGAEPRQIDVSPRSTLFSLDLRLPIAAQGKRLILEATGAPASSNYTTIAVVISSLPKEVPDWLLSNGTKV